MAVLSQAPREGYTIMVTWWYRPGGFLFSGRKTIRKRFYHKMGIFLLIILRMILLDFTEILLSSVGVLGEICRGKGTSSECADAATTAHGQQSSDRGARCSSSTFKLQH